MPETWSRMDPDNISPFVAYLATEDCPAKGSTPVELTAPRRMVLCGEALDAN